MHDVHSPHVLRTIDLDDSSQVAKFCQKFECSEVELREAVRMVGPTQIWVEQWIRWLKMN